MAVVTANAPGSFCWPELATSDQQDAKRFYTGLFGWTIEESPMGPGDFYTIFKSSADEVAAAYTLRADQQEHGVPPHWMSYVAVASADESAARAKELGGIVFAEPFDVFDFGRMAVLQDPTGAPFSLWEPRKHIGARRINEPGALCWTELATRDAATARAFYQALFGWEADEVDAGGIRYTIFANAGVPAGGMLQMTHEWGDASSHWMPYFAVADCDQAVARAAELGGEVMVPATNTPHGRFAVLKDPQGAVVSIIKQTMPA